MTTELHITQPDDWHCHLRDGQFLSRTVSDTARSFKRVLVMPNLKPPVTTVEQARDYRNRIIQHISPNVDFQPFMTLYLTEQLSPELITAAKKSNIVLACKYYPSGATTHSDAGVSVFKKMYAVFEQMQSVDMPLCIHGESIAKEVDIFDREKMFLNDLRVIMNDFTRLRIVLEHISTQAAVEFVMNAPKNIAATITPHHLHYNRNDLFQQGIRPHYFCMPILKRANDQHALIHAATSGNQKFFLGTDSAPHSKSQKENACGCAGIYSAHAALTFYAEIFEENNALARLENFASVFGAEFYQLPLNKNQITLIKKPWKIADTLSFGDTQLVPMKAGEMVSWQIQ